MTEAALHDMAGMGHNNPPVPLTPSPEDLTEYLNNTSERVRERKEALLNKDIPQVIETEEEAEEITDFIKNLNACKKNLEEIRKKEKQPFFELGKTVDSFFKEHQGPLDIAKGNAQKPLNEYLQRKAAEERKRREEEAQRLREEAEKKAREAQEQAEAGMEKEADATMKRAAREEKKAERFEKSAESGVGLAAARGQSGGVASMRKSWVGEITNVNDLDLEQLREFISRDALESAVNRFVKNGGRNLRGASIYEKTEAVVR